MTLACLSYRNGKYQGSLNPALQRHGPGVLIDDDLTFHVSNWHEDKLHGPTLIYLAHAKYIYGEWKNNEPHGLNVYRSGDTVLLSKYMFGVPSHRCLLIFERHSFACVLGECNKQWEIVKSGLLVNHASLMKFIELLQVDVPDHYLSLIKFACTFSAHANSIKTFPCHQNYCYFGYVNGLAIVFNSNNGVVTVGEHLNEQLCQFGGRFVGKKCVEEGNFSGGGEVVKYGSERPTQRIYQIYQKLHKKDYNFVNEACEAKAKVFASIQSLIVNKLKSIVEESKRSLQINPSELNDSLNYQEKDEEESLKLHQIREKMYSPPKRTFEKTPSKADLPSTSLLKKSFKRLPLDLPPPQIQTSKIGVGRAERQKQSMDCLKADTSHGRVEKEGENLNALDVTRGEKAGKGSSSGRKGAGYIRQKQMVKQAKKESLENTEIYYPKRYRRQEEKTAPTCIREERDELQETSSFKKLIVDTPKQQRDPSENHILIPPRRTQGKYEGEGEGQSQKLKREKSIQRLARPNYEDIQERRKRILKDLEELRKGEEVKKDGDSPYREDLLSVQTEAQSSFGFIPLSISNKLNQKRQKTPSKPHLQPQKTVKEELQGEEEKKTLERSTSKKSYNYSRLESRVVNENKQQSGGQAGGQANVSPARGKRTYQYMYE